MSEKFEINVQLDEADREILRALQADSSLPVDRIGARAGLSKTATWNRIQRLAQSGVISRYTIVVNPEKVGIGDTFFIQVKTSAHDAVWLDAFAEVIGTMPEITEAHRLAGEIDYLLKVQVASARAFDEFYKRLVSQISIYSVTSNLSMEVMKRTNAVPL